MSSGAIKGINIQLGADATKFTAALKKCDKEIKSTATQLKEVNNGLKFNPDNVTLLTQKAQLLEKQIENTKDNISTLKKALAEMDAKGVDKTSAEYQKLEREIITSESKLKHFNAELIKTRAAASNIGQLGAKFETIGKSAAELGNKLRGLSIAAGAVTAAVAGLALKSAAWADDLNTLSKQYSVTTKQLQLYGAAANLVDVETGTLLKSMQKMKKTMSTAASGSGTAAKAYEQLGVKVTGNNGKLRDSNKVFNETIAALGKMRNETERDALAMQIFGKSAAELNPLIEDGGEAYAKFTDAMAKHKIEFVDQKTLDKANAFNDTLDTTKALMQQGLMVAGTRLAAYLAPTIEKIADKVQALAGAISRMSPVLLTVAGGVGAVIAALAPGLLLFGKVSELVGSSLKAFATLGAKLPGVSAAFKGLSAVLAANPIIAVAAAIAALATVAVKSGADISKLGESVANLVTKAISKAAEMIPGIVEGITANMPQIIQAATQIVVGLITGLAKGLPQLVAQAPAILKALATGIISSIPVLIKAGGQMIAGIVKGLKSSIGSLNGVGRNIVQGLWNGASSMVSWVVNKFASLGKSILKGIKNALGIHSPSRVFRDEVGKNIVLGIAEGITGTGNVVDAAMNTINGKLTTAPITVGATPQTATSGNVSIVFNGNYSFMNDDQVRLFMERAEILTRRRLSTC